MSLHLEGIRRSYNRKRVLDNASLNVPAGTIATLEGANGVGKTTLLRIAATHARPDQGTLTIAGVDARANGAQARAHIGYVPHEPALYDELSPREHLELAHALHRAQSLDVAAALASAGMQGVADRPCRTLSRGQRQRVQILLATAHRPAVLLLDEPFTGLDANGADWLEELLASSAAAGAAILVVLHDAHQAERIAHARYVLHQRQPVPIADPDEEPVPHTHRAYSPADVHQTPAPPAPGASSPTRRGAWLRLLAKDVRREVRGKEGTLAGAVLVLTFSIAFLFAFGSLHNQPRAASLVLWLPLLYAGVAASGRAFANEADRGTLTLLRSLPVPLGYHTLARTAANALLLLLLAALCTLAASAVWSLPVTAPLLALLALGAIGIAITGTMTGALAAQANQREVLLPILAVPALAPLLQATIQGALVILAGGNWSDVQAPLLLAAGYDVIALGIAWILAPILMEGD